MVCVLGGGGREWGGEHRLGGELDGVSRTVERRERGCTSSKMLRGSGEVGSGKVRCEGAQVRELRYMCCTCIERVFAQGLYAVSSSQSH